jgi:hypothetical protein
VVWKPRHFFLMTKIFEIEYHFLMSVIWDREFDPAALQASELRFQYKFL